jgi:hypothetical protein
MVWADLLKENYFTQSEFYNSNFTPINLLKMLQKIYIFFFKLCQIAPKREKKCLFTSIAQILEFFLQMGVFTSSAF